MVTSPCSGCTSAASTQSKVVFPAPDGPVTATSCPGATRRSTGTQHLVPVVGDVDVPGSHLQASLDLLLDVHGAHRASSAPGSRSSGSVPLSVRRR